METGAEGADTGEEEPRLGRELGCGLTGATWLHGTAIGFFLKGLIGLETKELPLILVFVMGWVGLEFNTEDLDADWVPLELDMEDVEGLFLLGKVEGVLLLQPRPVLLDLGVVESSSDTNELAKA